MNWKVLLGEQMEVTFIYKRNAGRNWDWHSTNSRGARHGDILSRVTHLIITLIDQWHLHHASTINSHLFVTHNTCLSGPIFTTSAFVWILPVVPCNYENNTNVLVTLPWTDLSMINLPCTMFYKQYNAVIKAMKMKYTF